MFVIYHIETTLLVGREFGGKRDGYKSEAAAKGAMTRMSAQHRGFNPKLHAIAPSKEFYATIEKKETVYSMMDKDQSRPIVQGVNTPAYMDPSCESYWSM